MLETLRHLIALTLVSSAITAGVLLIRRPVRQAFGAAVSYRLWLLVPLSMVAMLLPGIPGAGTEVSILIGMDAVYSLVGPSLSDPIDARASIDWPTWLVGAWAVGAVAFFAYFTSLQRAYVKGLGKLSELRGTLRAETSAGCPALLGVFAPRVVLPPDFESRYTAQEQALILAHENVHLQRRDSFWNGLLVFLRCAFWFNPLIHIAASFMRVDQELACDAAVIERHPASKRTYADAMLKTELADAALPVGCHWRSSHPFKERLEMLKMNLPSRARRAVGGGLFAVVSVVVGYAAWAVEPEVVELKPSGPIADISVSTQLAPHTKGVLRFGPDTELQMASSTVTSGPNGAQILEGDVRIDLKLPADMQQRRVVLVRRTPDGVQRTESDAPPRALTITAQKVTLTPMPDGGVMLEFENGSVVEH